MQIFSSSLPVVFCLGLCCTYSFLKMYGVFFTQKVFIYPFFIASGFLSSSETTPSFKCIHTSFLAVFMDPVLKIRAFTHVEFSWFRVRGVDLIQSFSNKLALWKAVWALCFVSGLSVPFGRLACLVGDSIQQSIVCCLQGEVGTLLPLCACRRLARFSRCMCRPVCRLAAGLVLGPEERTEQKDWTVNPKHLHLDKFYFGVVPSELDYEIIP